MSAQLEGTMGKRRKTRPRGPHKLRDGIDRDQWHQWLAETVQAIQASQEQARKEAKEAKP